MELSYAQKLALKAIEITTGLKHGSKQSFKYLHEAELKVKI